MTTYKHRPLSERFWAKVKKTNGCWLWTATMNGVGYGMLYPGPPAGQGAKQLAHRISYEMHFGPIPPGIIVMHKCDNPGCVNPDHLQLGTKRDNFFDAVNKGRRPLNPRVNMKGGPKYRFDQATTQRMRDLHHSGVSLKNVGKMYGVSRTVITRVIRGS